MATKASKEFHEQGRLLHAAIPLEGHCLHLVGVYGHPNSATCREQAAKKEPLLQEAMQMVARLGGAPAILAGDLNTTVEASPCLLESTRFHGITDLACVCGEPQPTCFQQVKSQGTRIDHALANPAAASLMRSFDVMQDTGLPTHRPLQVRLSVDGLSQEG